jgi:hypothetical protein
MKTMDSIKLRLAAWHAALGSNVPDMLIFAGAASISYGAWLMYPPAGFITGGLLLLAAGVIASRSAD